MDETEPVLMRYRFGGAMRIGDKTRLPSGRVYRIQFGQSHVFAAAAEDVDALLEFRGECCNSRRKQPLFERA